MRRGSPNKVFALSDDLNTVIDVPRKPARRVLFFPKKGRFGIIIAVPISTKTKMIVARIHLFDFDIGVGQSYV